MLSYACKSGDLNLTNLSPLFYKRKDGVFEINQVGEFIKNMIKNSI